MPTFALWVEFDCDPTNGDDADRTAELHAADLLAELKESAGVKNVRSTLAKYETTRRVLADPVRSRSQIEAVGT